MIRVLVSNGIDCREMEGWSAVKIFWCGKKIRALVRERLMDSAVARRVDDDDDVGSGVEDNYAIVFGSGTNLT